VLGVQMAERLDVGLGDKLVFMSQQKGQTDTQSRLFRVRGIFRTGASSLDGFLVAVHVDAARELLETETGANQVAVHLPSADMADALTPQVVALMAGSDVTVLHWRDAVPEIMGMIAVDKQSNDMIMLIMGMIVALGVLNAILMSTLERTREFGVMMSVGMPARRVVALVITEGFLLGLFGMLLGVMLGVGPCMYLIETGLDFRDAMGETIETGGIAVSALIKGAWDWPRIGQYAIGVVLFTTLAAVWPAWRVSGLSPVDAMRHH
jgi:ABC-type lipoprotein release transport system permease subunit